MSYEYGSESKLLELPNPYQLQNRLLWLCGALLVVAGVVSLLWAQERDASRARCAWPPRRSSPGCCCSPPAWSRRRRRRRGCASSSAAAGRHRSRPRSRPARAAARPPPTAIKEILRQGGLTYPEPQGAVEGLLYHWAPTLITAPREVQLLARRYMFNLAAIAATLLSFAVLVVRVRQRGDAALDRHPLLRLRRRVPAPAGAVAAQGAGDDGCRWSAWSPRRSSARSRSAWSRRSCRRSARSRSTPRPSSCSAPRSSPARWRWWRSWPRSTPRRRRAPASSRSGCR